jgi:hypothetical protein
MATDRAARIAALKARLTTLQSSINDVLEYGQSLAGEGRAKTRADLGELRQFEKETQRELKELEGQGRSIRVTGVVYR